MPAVSPPDTGSRVAWWLPLFFGERATRNGWRGESEEIRAVEAVRAAALPKKEEVSVNWDRIEGNWKQFRGEIRQRWAKLTDDDVNLVRGKRTELVGRIQERYGVAKDRAEEQIDEWLKSLTEKGQEEEKERAGV